MSIRPPQSERSRVEAIEQYGVFAAPADPALNDLTRLTAQICNATVAAVMLVDGERRVYQAVFGLHLTDLARGATPCDATILGSGLHEIRDAFLDVDHPGQGIAMGGRMFRFYAGVPLTTPTGVNIGALFVMDAVARRLSQTQRDGLTILGRQVMTRLELTGRVRQVHLPSRERRRVGRSLDRMKDEFVSMVSHELRTPLTSLRAALGLIQSGTLSSRPEKTKQMLGIAVDNTDRLVRLVNDIVDLERIGSGMAELHFTMCSMDDLLRGAVALQQTEAAKAGIELTVDAKELHVWADPERTMQAIAKLLSNAIKFSPNASRIALIATKVTEDEARVEVRDTGPGIPDDRLEQIFDRFQQIDATDSRQMGGMGLGLAICKSIVQQHGGRIWATSRPGEGSSFFLTLPTGPSGQLR